MEVGDSSVVIAASSAHRVAALEVSNVLTGSQPMQHQLKLCLLQNLCTGCCNLSLELQTLLKGVPLQQACHWVIDELKATVPIWKKEFFADGSVWKENAEFRPVRAAS